MMHLIGVGIGFLFLVRKVSYMATPPDALCVGFV